MSATLKEHPKLALVPPSSVVLASTLDHLSLLMTDPAAVVGNLAAGEPVGRGGGKAIGTSERS